MSSKLSVQRRRIWMVIGGSIALLIAAFFLLFRPPALPPAKPADLTTLDRQLGDYILEKIKWTEERPRDAIRHATLGIVYAVNGLWSEALVSFQNAAKLNPKEPLAHMYVAIATQELGHQEESLGQFRNLVANFPNFPQGFYRFGEALQRAGQISEAEHCFQRLIELAPKEWRGYAGLADVRMRQNRYPEAVQLLQKALQLDPNSKISHHLLGMALRGLGNMEDATRELKLGLDAQVYPMPDAWSETASQHMKLLQDQIDIADNLLKAGQPQKAVELLIPALKYHPENVSLLNNLAAAYYQAGVIDRSRDISLRVLQLDKGNLSAHLTVCLSLLAQGADNEALVYAERAITLGPTMAQGYLAKANVLLAMERDIEAIEALSLGSARDPQNPQLQLAMGDIYRYNLIQTSKAIDYYREATRIDPSLSTAYEKLADLYVELGDFERAQNTIQSLRKFGSTGETMAILERKLQKLKEGN